MNAEMIDSILRSIGLESLRNEVPEPRAINDSKTRLKPESKEV